MSRLHSTECDIKRRSVRLRQIIERRAVTVDSGAARLRAIRAIRQMTESVLRDGRRRHGAKAPRFTDIHCLSTDDGAGSASPDIICGISKGNGEQGTARRREILQALDAV